jgi:hypothetical protein
MLVKAIDSAYSKGIPLELLKRDHLVISNYNDVDFEGAVDLSLIGTSHPLYTFVNAARFSLPDALASRLYFLTSKKYTSNIKDVESYIYFLIQALYYREPQYEFLKDEIMSIKNEISRTGTFYSKNCDFINIPKKQGTFTDHLIACSFMVSEQAGKDLDLKNIMDVANIIIHLPLVSQFAARTPYIEEPSLSFMGDWNDFVSAGKELFSVVHEIYTKLNGDYWKTYYFFVNNDVIEIAKILSFSDIDESAVDNWVDIPKSFTGDSKTYVSLDNLNYIKWSTISRY